MPAQNGLDFEGEFNNAIDGLFKNNTSREISPTDQRALVTAIRESYVNRLDDAYTFAFPQVSTSGTNTYAATPSPAISAYANGQAFKIKFTNASSGASTLNLNGLGAKKLYVNPTTQADTGDVVDEQVYLLIYDAALDSASGGFLMIGGSGGGGGEDPASETVSGIAELATQSETNAGTDDARIVTPLKLHTKNRQESVETADRALAQTDDQKVLFANKATTLTFDLPSLEENTYIIIVQVNAGDVAFTTSGGVTFENPVTPAISGDAIGSGIALWYRTSTSVLAFVGDISNLLTSLSINGTLAVKAGNSSGIIAKVGGVIKTDTTTVGNITTGEDTLYTYSVPAATLAVDKDSIRGFVAGTFAANGNNKTIKVKFGAITILNTGAVAFNAGSWRIDFFVVRTGATTQKCFGAFTSSNTTLDETATYIVAAETLSGAVSLTVTGEATATNDIVGEIFRVEFMPHE